MHKKDSTDSDFNSKLEIYLQNPVLCSESQMLHCLRHTQDIQLSVTQSRLRKDGSIAKKTVLNMVLFLLRNTKHTSLMYAAYHNDCATVESLIDASNINVSNFLDEAVNNLTAMHVCCAMGNHQIMRKLLKANASVNHLSQFGASPLSLCCMNGDLVGSKLLIEANANVNTEKRSPISSACLGKNDNVINLLLDHKADLGKCDPFAIISGGSIDLVKKCIENYEMDWNLGDPLPPIYVAIEKGYCDMVELLLQQQLCNVDTIFVDSTDTLSLAIIHGDLDIIQVLASHGYDIKAKLHRKDSSSLTPLCYACLSARNAKQIFDYLLSFSDNITQDVQKANENYPLLCCAAVHCNEELIEYLVQFGLLLRVPFNGDVTLYERAPIACSAYFGNKYIIDKLSFDDCNPEQIHSLLQIAVLSNRDLQLVKHILRKLKDTFQTSDTLIAAAFDVNLQVTDLIRLSYKHQDWKFFSYLQRLNLIDVNPKDVAISPTQLKDILADVEASKWIPVNNSKFPAVVTDVIFSMLLTIQRLRNSTVTILPPEIVMLIVRQLADFTIFDAYLLRQKILANKE